MTKSDIKNPIIEGKVVKQTEIPNCGQLTIRYPTYADAAVMTDYINDLSNERTYVTFQGEKMTLEDEQSFLKAELKKINDKESTMLLAFIDDQLIGISAIQPKSKVSMHEGVFGISISKQFRKKGIGELLFSSIIDEAQNISTLRLITLEVFSINKAALRLYHKFGFIEYGTLPGGIYYNNDYCDNIYMYKKIS